MACYYQLTGLNLFIDRIIELFSEDVNVKSKKIINEYLSSVSTVNITISDELNEFCDEYDVGIMLIAPPTA